MNNYELTLILNPDLSTKFDEFQKKFEKTLTDIDFKIQHLIPKNTITKANLLELFKEQFNKNIEINHIDSDVVIDRTLDTHNPNINKDLWTAAGYAAIPTIEENIEELANSELTKKIMF